MRLFPLEEMSAVGTSRSGRSALKSPLTAEWPAAAELVNSRQRSARTSPTERWSKLTVQPPPGNTTEAACSLGPRRDEPRLAKQVGIRPPANVQARGGKNGVELLARCLGRYQEIALKCKESSVQLAKIEAERRWQLEEMARFSEEIKAKVDQLHVLEGQISGALAEESRENGRLREIAARRGYI
ncbi:uncharacterized protein Tco025E_06837 [Trypanosoma conorhini]|uniref:Uncharacterized protein n=1 Tax=Trypanosoma conorhini TaxID=83891 RepID=A0A422P0K7_9TRYP|nr:uncharacterized protein Tco025E_06837 [Trypanosoma conorhini]RNF11231.1 hypothetical protein Tco025E_06837 [Trypanosoma conorhini]